MDDSLKRNPVKRMMAFAVSATLALGIAPLFTAPAAFADDDVTSSDLAPAAGSDVTGSNTSADASADAGAKASAKATTAYIAVKDMKPEATYTTEGTWTTDDDDLFNMSKMFQKEVEITVSEEGEYNITLFSNKVKTYSIHSVALTKQNDSLTTQDEDGEEKEAEPETTSANVKEGDKFTVKTTSLEKVKLTVKIAQENKTTQTTHDVTLNLNLDTLYNENQCATGFIDVSPDHWVVKEGWLSKAVDQGLMNGYKNSKGVLSGKFGADDTVTRGQFATILFRDANPDSKATTYKDKYEENETPFTDNEDSVFYTAAINWAYKQKIMTGDKDENGNPKNTVRPDDPISREEMATMLFRYNADEEAATSQSYKDAPDADSVSPWAVKGIAWCYDNKVMTGNKTTKELNPQNQATRAETAKMSVVATGIVKENAEKKAEEEEKAKKEAEEKDKAADADKADADKDKAADDKAADKDADKADKDKAADDKAGTGEDEAGDEGAE